MSEKYIVTLDRAACIGCGSCVAVCGEIFEMAADGRSHLKAAKLNDKEVLELLELGCAKSAVEICPVGAIAIAKKKK